MANIYDMNAAIKQPNIMGNFQQGMQFGQEQRKLKEHRLDQQNLRNLAPAIMGGDPNAYEQAAVIDPKAAQGYQDASDAQYRRLKGAVDFVNKARADAQRTGDMRHVNAALQQVGPYFSKLIGKPVPPEWTPDMDAGWTQLEARVAMADQKDAAGKGVLSTYVDKDGNRVAVNRDGTTTVLGGADQGMSQQTITVNGPDGRPAQYTFNKRTGSYEPATLGGGQAPLQADSFIPGEDGSQIPMQIVRGADGQVYRVQVGDPNAAQAGAADMGAGGQASSVQFPQRDVAPAQRGGASPFVGRSPEEDAAAVEAAKQRAQLEYLPRELGMRSDAAVDQAVRTEAGKTAVEKAAAAPAAIATLQTSIDSIDALLNDPDLGSIVGLSSMNPLNQVPGTKARGLIARADQIAGQSFLAAFNQLKGGGAITEREGEAATKAMARLDRSQSEADYKAALTELKGALAPAMTRLRQQAAGGSQGGSTAPVQRARNPQTGQVVVLRNGQWVPE